LALFEELDSKSTVVFFEYVDFLPNTVKLGDKERFDKEQIGVKELFTDYQPFYTINLLIDKELLVNTRL